MLLLPSWRETNSKFLNAIILRIFKWWKQWSMYLASCSKVDVSMMGRYLSSLF
jgi:hypothetical protein